MTTPSYSDTCALPPIDRVRAKVAELGLSDTGIVDRLFALDAETMCETKMHLTRLEIGGCVMADGSDKMIASIESLVFFLVGMTTAEMMVDYKKKNGLSLAETVSKHTCKNC